MKAVVVLVDIQTGDAVTRLFEGEGAVEAAAAAIEPLRQEFPGRNFVVMADPAARADYQRRLQREIAKLQLAMTAPTSTSAH